jgi:hypothetical protein
MGAILEHLWPEQRATPGRGSDALTAAVAELLQPLLHLLGPRMLALAAAAAGQRTSSVAAGSAPAAAATAGGAAPVVGVARLRLVCFAELVAALLATGEVLVTLRHSLQAACKEYWQQSLSCS